MYNQREIVLVPIPYSNLSLSKRRPVLIISNNHYNKNYLDILIAVITSHLYKDNYSNIPVHETRAVEEISNRYIVHQTS